MTDGIMKLVDAYAQANRAVANVIEQGTWEELRQAEIEKKDSRAAVVEALEKLTKDAEALMEAVKGFHTWAYGQRKQQSKGGHASFDYMELREQMDIAEAAIAAQKGTK